MRLEGPRRFYGLARRLLQGGVVFFGDRAFASGQTHPACFRYHPVSRHTNRPASECRGPSFYSLGNLAARHSLIPEPFEFSFLFFGPVRHVAFLSYCRQIANYLNILTSRLRLIVREPRNCCRFSQKGLAIK